MNQTHIRTVHKQLPTNTSTHKKKNTGGRKNDSRCLTVNLISRGFKIIAPIRRRERESKGLR
jgi:hypothetical protein